MTHDLRSRLSKMHFLTLLAYRRGADVLVHNFRFEWGFVLVHGLGVHFGIGLDREVILVHGRAVSFWYIAKAKKMRQKGKNIILFEDIY